MRDTHNGAHGRAADGSKLLHALHNTCVPTSPRALSTRLAPAAGDWAVVDGVKLRQGRGVYDDGAKQRYEGEWQNDMMHGRGTFEYASGAKYEGEFVANKYDGYGSFIFSTGAKYEGHQASPTVAVGIPTLSIRSFDWLPSPSVAAGRLRTAEMTWHPI